jgi:transcriptional regulator with XRE-family HTH domain
MEIREILAVNLRHYRLAAGLSQEELAHRAEIDRTYISSLERCVYAAGVDVLERLARALGTTASELLREPSTPPSYETDEEERVRFAAAQSMSGSDPERTS